MKVLHVTSGNLYGGIETMLVTVAHFRKATPHMDSQFAVCFDGRLRTELEATGARVHVLGPVRARNPLSVRRARFKLRTTIEHEGIDVVVCHSNWPLALFGSTALSAARPLVLWQHGPVGSKHWVDRWANCVTPGLVIFSSKYMAARSSCGRRGTRVEIVYYPVRPSCDAAEVDIARRSSLRAQFGASSSETVIVQVSRLEEWKGHRLLLDSLSKLRDLPSWKCWIVGGPQRPSEQELYGELHNQAGRLGISDRVRFLGQRSDVPEILAASDIHCQPNIEPEPFGITFVEALYSGLPVVTTAMGGALEIVDETCGLLASEPDAESVAALLRLLISDPLRRRRLGSAGPQRAAELSDPTRQMQTIERVLSGIWSSERKTA